MTVKQGFTVVVDLGSTKIAALAGEKDANGKISILGRALLPSRGIRRGIVINPEEFAVVMKDMVEQLEIQTGEKIRSVDVSMAGSGIMTTVYEGSRYIESGIVSQPDVDYLQNEAFKIPLEPGYSIYHMFTRNYEIGDDSNVTVPVGHEGRKLVARYTIISAPSSYRESIEKALLRIGLQMGEFILSPLAISEAVISSEEKDLGVVVMDIGGGTTKMASYFEGRLMHMGVVPFGGESITRDIREGCAILMKKAEQLKREYGQAIGDFAEEEKVVSIPGTEGWERKEISFRSLAYIMQARLEEIIDSIFQHIEKSGLADRPAQGIVLTGGSSKIVNLLQLLKYRTGLDARLGFSKVRLSDTPDLDKTAYLGALGMLKIMLREAGQQSSRNEKKQKERNGWQANRILSNLGDRVTKQIRFIFFEDDHVSS